MEIGTALLRRYPNLVAHDIMKAPTLPFVMLYMRLATKV